MPQQTSANLRWQTAPFARSESGLLHAHVAAQGQLTAAAPTCHHEKCLKSSTHAYNVERNPRDDMPTPGHTCQGQLEANREKRILAEVAVFIVVVVANSISSAA